MPARFCKSVSIFLLLLTVTSQQIAFADETLIVTATVPANATNFPNSIVSSRSTDFAPGDTATYTITYGSTLATVSSFTLEAQWTKGTVQGDSIPTVDVVDYTPGSATNAYGATPPVIDTINRKIDWTITSFPAHDTNEIVTFSLKATNNYQGSNPVTFSVASRVIGPGVTTSDSTVDQTYQFPYVAPTATPFPTNTPGPTATPVPVTGSPGSGSNATPTPKPTITVAPTPIPSGPQIINITIDSLSDTAATVTVNATKSPSAIIMYGTSISSLTSNQTQLNRSNKHTFQITDLKTNTTYYFLIQLTDSFGRKTTSELYTFHTASKPPNVEINPQSVILIANGSVFLNGAEGNAIASVILPVGTSFQFRFTLVHPENAKQVQAIMKCATPGDNKVQLLEATSGVYTGQLTTPLKPQSCMLSVRISDTNGNITTKIVATIAVAQPLTITDANTKKPIEHARVQFWIFDQQSLKSVLITTQNSLMKNPAYSDISGIVPSLLQPGTYKIVVSAIGYQSRTIQFSLGGNSREYPQVALRPSKFSLLGFLSYYLDILRQIVDGVLLGFHTVIGSVRLFDLIAMLSVLFFFLLTLLAFSVRIHLPIILLPLYLIHHIKQLLTGNYATSLVTGKVYDDETNEAIGSAHVTLMTNQNQVIGQGITNHYGEFRIQASLQTELFAIGVVKRGYHPLLRNDAKSLPMPINLPLTPDEGLVTHAFFRIIASLHEIIGSLFETLLILSFVFEAVFGLAFNFTTTLPFLILTSCNLLLWVHHTLQLRRT